MKAFVLGAVVATTACVQMGGPPPATVTGAGEIGFSLAGPGGAALVVPVHVNGTGPYEFVLDTGATLTCIDTQLAERLQLPKPVGTVGVGATVDQAGRMGLRQIETLAVGDVSATGLTACEVDLQHMRKMGVGVDGLLGLNFLRAFTVTLDFSRQTLSLEQ